MASLKSYFSSLSLTFSILNIDYAMAGKLDFTEFIVMAQDLVKQKGGSSGGANISANAVFGSRLAASEGEPFRSLESIISIADKVFLV